MYILRKFTANPLPNIYKRSTAAPAAAHKDCRQMEPTETVMVQVPRNTAVNVNITVTVSPSVPVPRRNACCLTTDVPTTAQPAPRSVIYPSPIRRQDQYEQPDMNKKVKGAKTPTPAPRLSRAQQLQQRLPERRRSAATSVAFTAPAPADT